MSASYPCCACTHTLNHQGRLTQCDGVMRVEQCIVEEPPGFALEMRLLVCDKCGRAAVPKEAFPQLDGAPAE